ncbi:MAG: three-Cys-motif partner protein TcmP [Reyranella sp.]|nr:three-Cys-motif partner protein TcmP [Reyranella sp.]
MKVDDAPGLFPLLPVSKAPAPPFGMGYPVWSKNKALLIERYLHYFIMVTKHGAYIDGFAGPQRDNDVDLWSAKRVLEHEPKWLHSFVLCDLDEKQVAQLQQLKTEQPLRNREKHEPKRTISVLQGDFNQSVDEALKLSGILNRKTAAFCLLDQRTFECHWDTIRKVAEYRPQQKVELFYLMPIYWLKRSLAAVRDLEKLKAWWGRDDWSELQRMTTPDIGSLVCNRFMKEFKYQYVQAWPVRRSKTNSHIMYFMIHATDHPEAPKLMGRAFRKTDSRNFEDLGTMDLEEFLAKDEGLDGSPRT